MSCSQIANIAAVARQAPGAPPELEREDMELGHLFNLSPDMLALASEEPLRWGRINPAFRRTLGWAEDEVAGHAVWDLVHQGDHERLKAAEATVGSFGSAEVKVRVRCKRGSYRWINWSVVMDGGSERLLFTGRDVTHSHRVMKALRKMSARMQRENEDLEQFVRSASHDLQEPLRTLSMYSDLLRRTCGTELPEDSKDLLLNIFCAAKEMQDFIRNMLAYVRISQEQDDRQSTFRDVSLEQVWSEVIRKLQGAIAEGFATITHDPLPTIYGDDLQVTQLLLNLLSNSLKYRQPGKPVNIHLAVETQQDELQFQMTDDGRGFDPKHAETIFQAFTRLHGHEIPGTGLGLPICSRIVERHGGRIWAEGRPGEGASFCFTLPAGRAGVEARTN